MNTDDHRTVCRAVGQMHVAAYRQPTAAGDLEGLAAHAGIVARLLSRAARAATPALLVCACSGAASTGEQPPGPPRAEQAAAAFDSIEIEVTGDDFRWHVRYPGADGVLGTADDVQDERDVHVPAHTPTVLQLRSRDFVYKLRLPDFGTAEIAVPRQEFALRFDSGDPGVHELRGDQFCGFSHPRLIGELHVQPADAFAKWMSGRPAFVEPREELGQ